MIIFGKELFGFYLPFIGFAYVPFFEDSPMIYMTDEQIDDWERDPWFCEVFAFIWLGMSCHIWNQEYFKLEEEDDEQ